MWRLINDGRIIVVVRYVMIGVCKEGRSQKGS